METTDDIYYLAALGIPTILVLGLAFYLLRLGLLTILLHRRLRQSGLKTLGRVTELRPGTNAEGQPVLSPVITYQVKGRTYHHQPREIVREHFQLGQQVPLWYLPEQPAKSTWQLSDSGGRKWLFLGLLALGLTIVCLRELYRYMV